MRQKFTEALEIPAGISCELKDNVLYCKKGSVEISRPINFLDMDAKISAGKIIFECLSGNKKNYKVIKSSVAHVKNLFKGLDKEYTYKLESCNVHFPMTVKVEKNKFIINNFLGEKQPRFAEILPQVKVDIKGQKITVSSADRDAAGQTAANIEKATKVRNRDRRVFQDGIYIVERPGAQNG